MVLVGQVYQCSASVVHLGTGTLLDGVRGSHLDGKNSADVDHLSLISQNLNFIPKDIEEHFPNLKAISWYNSNLQTLSADDLKPFPELQFFAVWMNRLTAIDGDLFQFTPKVQYIDFDSNLIERIGQDFFTYLEDLKIADFSLNPCVDSYANTPETLEALKWDLLENCTDFTVSTTTEPTDFTTEEEITSTPITSTTFSPPTPPEINQCSIKCPLEGSGNGRFPNRNDCTKYNECRLGVQHRMQCEMPQIYDVFTAACGDPKTSTCIKDIDCD